MKKRCALTLRITKTLFIHYFKNKTTLIILLVISIVTYIGLTLLNKFPYIFSFPVKVTEQNRLILYKNATRMVQ